MDIRLLRYFAACVDFKSLHAAADALHISQPALSKAIQNLESEVGAPLLERRPRGVVPTPYGETLLRYARMIDSELRRAEAELQAMRGATKGRIVVGCIPTMIPLVARAAREVLERQPGLQLEIRAAFSAELTASLSDGQLDFALILLPRGEAPVGLAFDSLLRTDPLVVARRGHPLSRRAELSLSDLLDYPWLYAASPPTHREIVHRAFMNAGLAPPYAAMEVSTIVFFSSLIAETDLLTVAPSTLPSLQGENAPLQALPIRFPFPPEEVGLAYRENARLLPGAKIVMDFIRAACAAPNAIESGSQFIPVIGRNTVRAPEPCAS
jgi:DNA-binding transcriptional LysR family regulator